MLYFDVWRSSLLAEKRDVERQCRELNSNALWHSVWRLMYDMEYP